MIIIYGKEHYFSRDEVEKSQHNKYYENDRRIFFATLSIQQQLDKTNKKLEEINKQLEEINKKLQQQLEDNVKLKEENVKLKQQLLKK